MNQHNDKFLLALAPSMPPFIKESRFCYSLSGLEVPLLTITSNVQKLTGLAEGVSIEVD